MANLTTTDKKDLEICKNILALYRQLSKKTQKKIHLEAGTHPFNMPTKVWCMEDTWERTIENIENGKCWWE